MIVVCVAGLGAAYPLTFLFAVDVLDGGAGAFGALEAAVGAGFLAGSLALVALASRVHKGRAMIIGLAVMGACLALVATTESVWVAAVPLAVFGIANAIVLIAVDTYLQQVVPHGMRGRVLGTRFTITQGTYALVGARGRRPRRRRRRAHPLRRRRRDRRGVVARRPADARGPRVLTPAGRVGGPPPTAPVGAHWAVIAL